MLIFKKCPFYQDSEGLDRGRGLGYCDLGGDAICEGDIQLCDRSDDLRKQLSEKKKKEDDKRVGIQKEKTFNYKVLVVDDQEPIRKLIVTLLSMQKHQCIIACRGVKALNKMIQNRCDAVITDIIMHEKDGITLTKELLSMYPKLPIMVMTGHDNEFLSVAAMASGAREFIKKPFSLPEYAIRFDKMMKGHEILLDTTLLSANR